MREAVGATKPPSPPPRAEASGRSGADQRRYERNVSFLFRLQHSCATSWIRTNGIVRVRPRTPGMNRLPARLELIRRVPCAPAVVVHFEQRASHAQENPCRTTTPSAS